MRRTARTLCAGEAILARRRSLGGRRLGFLTSSTPAAGRASVERTYCLLTESDLMIHIAPAHVGLAHAADSFARASAEEP
jgi:hypothetical protein